MKNIAQIAAESATFKTLTAALQATGLDETLKGPGPFTVFAPTDAAFAKLPQGTIDGLLRDREKLSSILLYHVLPGTLSSAEILRSTRSLPSTINGAPLEVTVRGGRVYVNGAEVVTPDVVASNGTIHAIDAVLLPALVAAGGW